MDIDGAADQPPSASAASAASASSPLPPSPRAEDDAVSDPSSDPSADPSATSDKHAPAGGANDYSRFDDIDESDEEGDNDDKKTDATPPVPVADRLFQAGTAKAAGNDHISKGEPGPAATQYRKGITVLEDMRKAAKEAAADGLQNSSPAVLAATQEVEAHELSLSLHLNLAMAEIKLKSYGAAIKAATEALSLDERNVKALFRRGQAHRLSGGLAEAKADMTTLLSIDAANGSAKKELAVVVKKIKENKAKEKAGFANLFERAGGVYDDLEEERKRKAEEKAAADAKLRADWEADMAVEEAKWLVEKSSRDAKEAAEKAAREAEEQEKAAAGGGAGGGDGGGDDAATMAEDHEKDITDFVQKKEEDDEDSDSDDEPDPLKVFVKTPFEEWKKKKEEKEKKEKEEKEKEVEKKKRAARDAKRAAERVEEKDQAEVDEEDARMLAEISKKGYCHHARKLDANEVITEISPQKVGDGDGGGGGGGGGGGSSGSGWSPKPASSAASSSAPQRIDKAGAGGGGGGSAWNQNGTTWEERDCSDWAKECAKRCLLKATHSSGSDDIRDTPENVVGMLDKLDMRNTPGNEAAQIEKIGELASMLAKVTARVTKVSSVSGDASVAVVRGKKRYLFDLTADVEYEVSIDESFGMGKSETDDSPAKLSKYKGKISLKEITHDAVNDGEVEVGPAKPNKGSTPPAQHKARVKQAVDALKNDMLKRCLSLFVTEFQSSQ